MKAGMETRVGRVLVNSTRSARSVATARRTVATSAPWSSETDVRSSSNVMSG